MKTSHNEHLDEALYKWFLQKRSFGYAISGPSLQEKAIYSNQELNGYKEFQASSGWFRILKRRHGIRELEMHGEKLSADKKSAEKFIIEFKENISKNFDSELIYNADETGLFLKLLPNRTVASSIEGNAIGKKESKERKTALLCAN